jgi:hypothetical protein
MLQHACITCFDCSTGDDKALYHVLVAQQDRAPVS